MKKTEKYILVSNDDGADAPGLKVAIDCARKYANVIAVAPNSPRSAQSSAITVSSNLNITLNEIYNGVEIYAVNGTPVDCVKLAVYLFGVPDFVIGGVNHGPNDGNAVTYSGTMGVVIEGCMLGVPSVGFSHLSHSWETDFSPYRPFIDLIFNKVIENGLPKGICMNVNMPGGGVVKGIKATRAARGYWIEEFEPAKEKTDEYRLTGRFFNLEKNNPETDCYWLERKYTTVVPVRADMSAKEFVAPLSEYFSDYN